MHLRVVLGSLNDAVLRFAGWNGTVIDMSGNCANKANNEMSWSDTAKTSHITMNLIVNPVLLPSTAEIGHA